MKKALILSVVIVIVFVFACQQRDKKHKQGIVVLSPEIAEIICALNAEEEITGITAECNYPPSLKAKKVVGSFSKINPESILALNPEYVFCSSLEQEGIASDLRNLGFQVEVIYPESISEMLAAIERIGANPDIIICYSQDTLENIINRKGWQNIPAIKNRRIYFEREINPDLIQRATPRCVEGMKILANIFAAWQKEQ